LGAKVGEQDFEVIHTIIKEERII